ncbi:hypothetical protein RFI_35383, partial [Reticulomyxa filosa]
KKKKRTRAKEIEKILHQQLQNAKNLEKALRRRHGIMAVAIAATTLLMNLPIDKNSIALGLTCYCQSRKNLQQRKIAALEKLGDISKEEMQKKKQVSMLPKNYFEEKKEKILISSRTLVKTEELTLSEENLTLDDCDIENLSMKDKSRLVQESIQASLPEQQEWDNVISNVDKMSENISFWQCFFFFFFQLFCFFNSILLIDLGGSVSIFAHCGTNVYFPFPFSVITFTILYLGYLCIGLIQSFEQKLSTQGIYALLFSSYSSRVPHIITTTHLQKIVISIAECANQLLNISWILGRA